MNKNRFSFVARSFISLFLIWIVFRKLDFNGVGEILLNINLRWAALASLLTGVSFFILSLRWDIFLRKQHINVPLSILFPLTWGGQFFNSILPGNTGGDVVKIYQICRFLPHQRSDAASTVIIDRLVAFIALIVLAAVAFVLQPITWTDITYGTPFSSPIWLISAMAFGLIFTVIGFLFLMRSDRWSGRITRIFVSLKSNISPDASLATGITLAFFIHFLNFFIVYLLGRSLGLAISITNVILFMPILVFLSMIPVTVNGHGLREIILIFYFQKFGIHLLNFPTIGTRETAIALSLLSVINDLIWTLPGGLVYLLRFRSVRPLHIP